MKKFSKKLMTLLLFCFALWAVGCTSDKKPSGQLAEATPVSIEETTEEQTTVSQETDAKQQDTTAAQETTAKQQETTATQDTTTEQETTKQEETTVAAAIAEDGSYTSKDDVALYLHTYGRLPSNFMTKKEAQALGWSGGGLDDYAYGSCIGGDTFGNYEGNLPKAPGRQYYECDIDTMHAAKRGAKRIVFSNDGLIYYTGDHYNTFELLYE